MLELGHGNGQVICRQQAAEAFYVSFLTAAAAGSPSPSVSRSHNEPSQNRRSSSSSFMGRD